VSKRETVQKELSVRYPALDVEYIVEGVAEGNDLKQLSIKRIVKSHYKAVVIETIEAVLEKPPFSIGISLEIDTERKWLIYVYFWEYPIWAYKDKVKKTTIKKVEEAFGRRD
jgi:hypothetical protein